MKAQELIIGHLLPIAATVAVFWLVYRLLFRNSNRLFFNRFFLLTSLLIALAMPLLGLLSGMESQQMVVLKQNLFGGGIMLSEVIVTPDGQPVLPEVTVTTNATPSRFSLWQVVGGIYLIGVGVMTLLFLFKLGRLVALTIRSPKRKMSGCTAVFTGRDQGSFSFFRYAFFPNENVDPDIMRHEMSHIAHRHSWDILFAEVMMILQWFNPFIYLYKKELQSLHEYQADRDVVATGVDKRNYMMLILQQCTAVDFSGMSNNFSLILTKKRIKMITKNEKAKGLWWRLLATLPVLAILMIANTKVTAQEKKAVDKLITVETGRFEIFDDDGTPLQLIDTVIYADDGSYVKFETSDAFDPMIGEPRKKLSITTHNSDGTTTGAITNLRWEMHGDTTLYTAEPFSITEESLGILLGGLSALEDAPSNDSIYQIVDEMPQFPGGEAAMMKFVASNVKYPQEARDKEIDGRVFISFVVEKDGSVSNVKVMRGIGGGCDEEAVRVVSAMPKWKPGIKDGKPVRVSYMMPLTFKLSDGQPTKPAQKADVSKPDMKPDKNGVYQIVEEMPQYPGGEQALLKYVSDNITYPQEAKDKEIQGRVFVSFVIEKDGSVNEVKVLRSIGGGCDEEAVRVIKGMPKWKPGKQEGKPVRVSYTMPINFKLDGSTTNGLENTSWEGMGTGKKDGTNYTMSMDMEFESKTSGYFVMTLTASKAGSKSTVFEDVGLPFVYSFDGKTIGSIQPMNPDGSQLGEELPCGFLVNKDGSIAVSFYDLKEDVGIEQIVFKKVVK
jgi:TonB family protein